MGRLRLFIVVIVSWIAGAAACFGQASAMNGEISGTVTDPTGSMIANAAVNITNLGTGFRQTGKTGDSGLYRFNLLPLGKYELEVEVPGFTPGKRSGIDGECRCDRHRQRADAGCGVYNTGGGDGNRSAN